MTTINKVKQLINNETLRNGVFFTVFSFINKGINFFLLILLAKYITPTEYGYWSLFGTILMFLGYFMAMSTEGYISISFFKEGIIGVKNTFSCILSTTLIVSSFLFCVTFLLKDHLQQAFDLPWQYICLAIGIAFFTVHSNVCLDFLRIKKKIVLYGLFSCCSAFFVLALSIVFVKYFLMGWQGCALAQSLSIFLFGSIGLGFFLFSKKIAMPNKKHWIMMLCWGIPLIPHLATNFIRLGCDRYIIKHYYSIEDVGLFSFAFTLSMVIMTIGSGFNQANSINIYEVLSSSDISPDEKMSILRNTRRNILVVNLCGLVTTILLAALLIPYFFPDYTPSIKLFFILSIYAFLECIYFLYTNFLFFYKKTQTLMHITFSFAALHLLLSLCFSQYSLIFTCLIYCTTQLGVVIFVYKKAIGTLKNNLYKPSDN